MYLDTKVTFDPRGFVEYLRHTDDPDLDYFIDLVSIIAELKAGNTKVCDIALLTMVTFVYHVRPLVTGLAVLDMGELVLHCGKVRMKFSKHNTHLLPVWSIEGARA